MGRKNENLDNLLDLIEESTFAMEQLSEDQVNELLRESGIDPIKAVESVNSTFETSFLKARKSRLQSARDSAAQLKDEMIARSKNLIPITQEARKRLLEKVLNLMPEIRPALTFQNRNFDDLTDEDIKTALEAMEKLGVLDDVKVDDE